MGPLDALINAALPWIIRLAGLFWLIGAFALFRQIQVEMALDREAAVRKAADGNANERWADRDDAARRGWIAGQAVVLMATAIAMILLAGRSGVDGGAAGDRTGAAISSGANGRRGARPRRRRRCMRGRVRRR